MPKNDVSNVGVLPEMPVKSTVIVPPVIPVKEKILAVPLLAQQTSMWCWAASAEMVMKYGGHDVTQCKQANHEFGRTDCCNSPVPNACVKGGWPEFPVWNFATQTTAWGVALTFSQIMAQINANEPVCFSWGWIGGGGHMMVARGYYWSALIFAGLGPFVYINDPWAPNAGNTRWISYADYVAKTNDHVHWVDYFDIKYTGAGTLSEAQEQVMDMSSTASNPPEYVDPDTAAREALKLLPALATPDVAHELGFASVPTDASAFDLGQSLPIFYIRHDALDAHVTGADVRKLLVDGEEMLYPIFKDGKAVCSVVVAKDHGVWSVRSVGDSNLVKQLIEVRDRQTTVSGKAQSKYFIVHIPSMYKMFVAHYDANGKLMLSHIHDDPIYGFSKHVTQDADHVISVMLPYAKKLTSALPPRQ